MTEPFHLERFFAAHEFSTRHLLAVSDCETLSVGALLELEPDAPARFGELRLSYTESAGSPELRGAVADCHPGLTSDHVLVHAAGVEVLFTACHALIRPGDTVVVQTPCYQALRTAPELAGGRVVPWRARWQKGGGSRGEGEPDWGRAGAVGSELGRWVWDEEELHHLLESHGPRLLILNSPHNPTGRRFDEATLRRLLATGRRLGVRVLVDEAYAGTESPEAAVPSAAILDETAVALGLVSKAMGLPGLRIGWLLSRDARLLAAVGRVKDHTTICAPAPAEFLAALALRHRDVILTRTRRILAENRAILREFMARRDDWFLAAPPEASSVCFPRVAPGAPLGADDLCRRAREEAGVLLAPGRLFGAEPPEDVLPPVADAVRIGFGRAGFPEGVAAFEAWLDRVAP